MPRATAWHGMARFVAMRWWQRHPLQAVVVAGEPALRNYAARHPWRLVAGAAAVGSLLVLGRAWRLGPRGWWWRTAIIHGAAASLLLSSRKRR